MRQDNELKAIQAQCRALEPYPYSEPPEVEIIEETASKSIKPTKTKAHVPTRIRQFRGR